MSILRKLLFPFSMVYSIVVFLRNRFYDWGLFGSKSYKTPIICIGNLSVGGTGKTPMVELLISFLYQNYKVAVLSRGYKRKSKGFVLAHINSTTEELGDEPFQIHLKFPDVIVAVDADRQNGIACLEKDSQPDVILLDDAFQHRKVKPSMSILLTASNSLYVDDWCLPTGNLRDSKREAHRADVLVVTKNPSDASIEQRIAVKNALGAKLHQKVLFSYLSYDVVLLGSGLLNTIDDLKKDKITLVTGIADAKPLVDFLTNEGVTFEHLAFSDHHFFTKNELALIGEKPNVLTTEKDYMRLGKKLNNCNYITVKHSFFGEGLNILQKEIDGLMLRYS